MDTETRTLQFQKGYEISRAPIAEWDNATPEKADTIEQSQYLSEPTNTIAMSTAYLSVHCE